jgi:hypothetical protein
MVEVGEEAKRLAMKADTSRDFTERILQRSNELICLMNI